MTDDPLHERSTPALDDEQFTRRVLRRARVSLAPRWWRLAGAIGGAALAMGAIIVAVPGQRGPALAAIAVVTWALDALGD